MSREVKAAGSGKVFFFFLYRIFVAPFFFLSEYGT